MVPNAKTHPSHHIPLTTFGGLAAAAIVAAYTDRDVERPLSIRRSTKEPKIQIHDDHHDICLDPNVRHHNSGHYPTNWNGYDHTKALKEAWYEACAKAGKPATRVEVVGLRNLMYERFPELREGDVPLSKEWVEQILNLPET